MTSMRYIKILLIIMMWALIGYSFVSCKSTPYCKESNLYKYKSHVTIPPDAPPLNKAEAFLTNMMDRYTGPFYIYRDFCDPRNHYVPSGWMPDPKQWPPKTRLKVEEDCTEGLQSSKEDLIEQNKSCIKIQSFCPPGSWIGVYWLDPLIDPKEKWGNQPGGFDLRGAKRLVFWARGEKGGEMIQCKMGGIDEGTNPDSQSKPLSSGWIRLGRDWKCYQIDLTEADLRNVVGGFCWVTNDLNSRPITIYLDDIYYDRPSLLNSQPRLVPSYLTDSLPGYIAGKTKAPFPNVALSYDNALIMLALMAIGGDENWARARQISEALAFCQEHDRFASDGRLRNGYWPGDLADANDQCRLPGYWGLTEKDSITDTPHWIEEEHSVSTKAGDMAWVMIAWLRYCELRSTKEPDVCDTFLKAATRAGLWIDTRLRAEDLQGGYYGELKEDYLFSVDIKFQSNLNNGNISENLRQKFKDNRCPLSQSITVRVKEKDKEWIITDKGREYAVINEKGRLRICDFRYFRWRSTEHNIDLYVAFSLLEKITGKSIWGESAEHAWDFVDKMWNEEDQHFWTGTNEKGSVNKDTIPLDVQTWAILAAINKDTTEFERYLPALEWARENLQADSYGYRFSTASNKDGTWFEGTAQMALACDWAVDRAPSYKYLQSFKECANHCKEVLRQVQIRFRSIKAGGIPATNINKLITGFDFSYFPVPHTGATAWFTFSELGYNPYWGEALR